jgi:hypothetical protein
MKDTDLPSQIDEEEFSRLARHFHPQPGQRFYERMAAAPWKAAPPQNRPWRVLAGAFLFVLLIVGVSFSYPQLRASAQQWLYYFMTSPSDQLSLQVVVPDAESEPQNWVVSDFPFTLAEVERLASYPVLRPAALPPGLQFSGAHFNKWRQEVTLKYSGPEQTLLLQQRPASHLREYTRIGQDTPVEKVIVRGVEGEAVWGAWRMSTNPRLLETSPPGTEVSVGVYWDAGYPQLILRWQEGEMIYELTQIGSQGGNIDALIQLANSFEYKGIE